MYRIVSESELEGGGKGIVKTHRRTARPPRSLYLKDSH